MKRNLLLILLFMLTLTACGNKGNIENNTTEAITETETETEDMTPLTNVDRGDSSGDVINNDHGEASGTQQGQQSSNNSENVKNNTGLYIYIDDSGILRCAKSLKSALQEALKNNNLSVDKNTDLIINKYYNATLNEDNTKIHHDIIDGLVADLAEELANKGQDSGNSNTETNSGNGQGNITNNEELYPADPNNEPSQPTTSDPGNYDTPGPGETTRPPMDLGDGGELITDIELNP